jgi:hypothetical protein
MNKLSIAVLTIAAVLFALPAIAGDDRSPNYTPRQLAHCVMARAKASPNESYKVAFKACREQLDTQTTMANVADAEPVKR